MPWRREHDHSAFARISGGLSGGKHYPRGGDAVYVPACGEPRHSGNGEALRRAPVRAAEPPALRNRKRAADVRIRAAFGGRL